MTINPWLEEKIMDFRRQYGFDVMESMYKNQGSEAKGLTWQDFVASSILLVATHYNSFLETSLADMDLPEGTKASLYKLYVDTVADLVQFTEEELLAFSDKLDIDLKSIEKYLKKHNMALYHSKEKTLKYPYYKIMSDDIDKGKGGANKVIEDPSLATRFNVERITDDESWFEEYYRQYEEAEGEDKLLGEYRLVAPDLSAGEFPEDYKEFFKAIEDYWSYYAELCEKHSIPPVYSAPVLPKRIKELGQFTNDQFVALKKGAIRSLIYLFNTDVNLFNEEKSILDYCLASDQQKLDIAEVQRDSVLEALLIAHVEIRIDIENLIIYFGERLNAPVAPAMDEGIGVNPWLAEVISKYQSEQSEGYLTEAYKRVSEYAPYKQWDEFLAESALKDAAEKNPVLKLKTGDLGLPEGTRIILEHDGIECLGDLIQFTEEEMTELYGEEIDMGAIRKCLKKYSMQLFHGAAETDKTLFGDIKSEGDLVGDALESARTRAKQVLEKESGLLKYKVKKAAEIYAEADGLACKFECEPRLHVRLLRDFAILLEEHVELSPWVAPNAVKIGRRLVALSESTYGEDSRQASSAHKICEAIESKTGIQL